MVKKIKNKTVFVGISGGVDSAIAAFLLKKQGYKVVGVFIQTWAPSFIDCTWKNERRDAMRVCAHLDIPFLVCDAEEEYKKGVAFYMIEEYKKGRTPNPDVMCNREIKFGVFWKFAKERGADFVATGHYVNLEKKKNNFLLKKNIDEGKDQVYFLWTLTQDDLSHILFPLGKLNKKKVREIAKKCDLPNANKKDSQGVCFLGPLDMKKFLEKYIDIKSGNVLDESGEIIGGHNGAFFFTIGERHNFAINKKNKNDKPLYVISKDIKNNTITVSQESPVKINNINSCTKIICRNTNWISDKPKRNTTYCAQIRYHGDLIKCQIDLIKNDEIVVVFNNKIKVDSGQSIVFYNKDVCLGGAVVD